MYIIFDTETTGLPKNFSAPLTDFDNWPRAVQLAWQLHGSKGELLNAKNYIIRPEGFTIPFNAEKVHGISTELAIKEGHDLKTVLAEFAQDVAKSEALVGHNVEFDINILGAEFLRCQMDNLLPGKQVLDTMRASTDYCELPGGRPGSYKPPKLVELYQKLFGVPFGDAHDAAYDVEATSRSFFKLIEVGVVKPMGGIPVAEVRYQAPVLDEANFVKAKAAKLKQDTGKQRRTKKPDEFIPYSHLHVHSMYSILQSTADVKKIVAKAREYKMPAVAITDLGNLHAAFNAAAAQGPDLKVIVGCEFYVAEERTKTQFTKDNPDRRFQQVLLAKNQEGYQNLSILCSKGYMEGYYDRTPRIGKDLIEQYKGNLICLTGNLYGEIPGLILNVGETQAEEAFKWWHNLFGDDFYVEINRHGLPEEDRVNEVLIRFADKYGAKLVAANDCYYLYQKDAYAHEVLSCIDSGNRMSDPVSHRKGNFKGGKYRFALPNNQFYFKTQEEMNDLFADLPEALEAVQEIVDKCSPIKLQRDILLPAFPLPDGFSNQDDYLRHLAYKGAAKRYGEPLTEDITQRIDFELDVIKKMGFPGYFLIVQDFIQAARDMGVSVGPGRGSAAGSVVAYCIGITNIDPIRYNLLFERFLNPERVSMPDIDIDFDDRGRQGVINWVVEKYGMNQVAQIVTYGTMAAKMSIKDVARALDMPLSDANYLAKLVPDTPGTTLAKAFEESPELKDLKENDKGIKGQVVNLAATLEGCVRGTGIHAAGVIIAPDDLLRYIPVCTSKDAELLVTQFDGKVVESAGMLKMDFLGLKTLTIIEDALKLIKKRHGVSIDIDAIPVDDQPTFELYQRGETVGTFQFESEGMRMYLKDLKPTSMEDLIAMNALYRPGPLQFIPNFIARKHGKEEIEYPHPLLEPILSNSNGIMVYQEQIMQAAQVLAGYSLGGADLLRRAMGKKKKEEMDKQRSIFVEGATRLHNIPKEKAEEIFAIMEKFAAYGFNRSHSAAYSVVAYQTAYLKANYPAEYMASVLSHSMGDIEKIGFFLSECKHMGLQVLGPDVNESSQDFDVNKEGAIRFGMAAIKGAGEAAVEAIFEERAKNGPFKSIWDFVERIDLRKVNKKTMESLAYAGAFDGFGEAHRAQFFHIIEGENISGIEKMLKYGAMFQQQKSSTQASLFGGSSGVAMPKPKLPDCEAWPEMVKLRFEKEVLGLFITGHPLDAFRMEMDSLCTPLVRITEKQGQEIMVGGILTSVSLRDGKNGSKFALVTIEDFDGQANLAFFGSTFTDYRNYLNEGDYVYIKGKVQERFNSPGKWELSPKQVGMLQELRERFRELRIRVDVRNVTHQLINELAELAFMHAGKCHMKIEIFHPEERIKLPMYSRKFRVDPSPVLMEKLKRLSVVEYEMG